jgi:hypothetical protein
MRGPGALLALVALTSIATGCTLHAPDGWLAGTATAYFTELPCLPGGFCGGQYHDVLFLATASSDAIAASFHTNDTGDFNVSIRPGTYYVTEGPHGLNGGGCHADGAPDTPYSRFEVRSRQTTYVLVDCPGP